MKQWFSKKGNIFFVLILTFVVYQQWPVMRNNFAKKNETIVSREVSVLSQDGIKVTFPPKDSRAIAIFWATWCAPCKVEMSRLKKSVESGEIPKDKIFAINPFESDAISKKFIAESGYPFTFVEGASISEELGVRVTPTTLFIDKGIITKMSSGMSIWGIWEAEFFL